MGLVTCPECKTEVSDTAVACPKCGAARTPKKKTSFFTWIIAVIAIMWLVGYLGTLSTRQDLGEKTASVSSLKDQVAKQLGFDFTWTRGGFDTILQLNAKVTNNSSRDIRDFTVLCDGSGASGTKIDSNQKTFYEIVKKNETKRFNSLNMGFLNSQVKSLSCRLSDFALQ